MIKKLPFPPKVIFIVTLVLNEEQSDSLCCCGEGEGGGLVSIITLFSMELTNNFSRINIFPNFHECDSTNEN